ncbi:MAG: hypothetical protein ACR2HC_01415 [Thermoleophilaceae bacterium]
MPEPADNVPEEPISGEIVPDGEQLAEVRNLPVPAGPQPVELDQRRPVSLPATVVAATGGFVLGVAAFVLIRVLRQPRSGRALAARRARKLAKARGVDVQSSRSFLVDVHLLKR